MCFPTHSATPPLAGARAPPPPPLLPGGQGETPATPACTHLSGAQEHPGPPAECGVLFKGESALSRHWGAGSPWRGHATGRLREDESLGAGGSTSPPPDLTASPQGSGTRRREGSLPDQQPPRHFCGRGLIGGHTGQRPWGSLRGVWANPAPPAEPGQAHAGGRWALGPASGGPASHTATPRPGGEACPAPGCVPHPAGPRT